MGLFYIKVIAKEYICMYIFFLLTEFSCFDIYIYIYMYIYMYVSKLSVHVCVVY